MKKIIPIAVIGLLLLTGIGTAGFTTKTDQNEVESIIDRDFGRLDDYTHTVLVEIATGQYCSFCRNWAEFMYDEYTSEVYDFEYVEMIAYSPVYGQILNDKAYDWMMNYSITEAIPHSIMDGNYSYIHGVVFDDLEPNLNSCGNRAVDDIEASLTVEWMGDAEIYVNITILNNELFTYNGHIRASITEIESRYFTKNGGPYHFGFLDYAYNDDISIPAGETHSDSILWDGDIHGDNLGVNFGDIVPENIQVTMGVFDDSDGYNDETVTARIHPYECGDANGDGVINVSDVVYIVNYIFVSGFPAPDPLCRADADGSGNVDITDAVHLINYIFIPGSPPPVEYCC